MRHRNIPLSSSTSASAFASVFVLAFVLISCNGGTDSEGGSGFTAKIDGKSWEAAPISISAQANAGVTGSILLVGSQSDGDKSRSITITLYNVGGPGKYPLGTGISVFGGVASVGEGTGIGGNADVWITPGSGIAGEVEITSVDGGRIKGSFAYTTAPGENNAVRGSRVVTEGRFDLPLSGTVTALPENAGSKVTAELNGVHYNAALVFASLKDFAGAPGLTLSSSSAANSVSINLAGVTGPGTYSPLTNFAPQRLITVGLTGGTAGTCCWGVNAAGTTGEVVVTSLSAKRVKGTFTATLKPQAGKPATQVLVIKNGTFDIGIP